MLGLPVRKLWYLVNMNHLVDGTEPTDGAYRNFFAGDMSEAKQILMLRLAGYKVEDYQKKVEICGIKGSLDGYVVDKEGNRLLIDFKSANKDGFNKFLNNDLKDDSFGYYGQLSSYAFAEGQDEAAFLVEHKDTGSLTYLVVDWVNIMFAEKRVELIKEAVSKPEPPADKCYKLKTESETKRKYLNINCAFCPFKELCYGEENLEKEGNKVFYKEDKQKRRGRKKVRV